jgi:hypothetical protein
MATDFSKHSRMLSAEDLLAGSKVTHEITMPPAVLFPYQDPIDNSIEGGQVRLRPLSITTLNLISRAARDDASLVPLLMIQEAMVEPAMNLNQIQRLHVGLVHFLVSHINLISGLSEDGEILTSAANSPLGRTHLLLAKHFGWTPEQVSQLTPGQVAVYLAGIEKLLEMEREEV